MRSSLIPGLMVALAAGCVVIPDGDNIAGPRTKTTAFVAAGYSPTQPPFATTVQQLDSSGNWVTTVSTTATDGSSLLPAPGGGWYPWQASISLSGASTYWQDSTTFGGVVSTQVHFPQTPYAVGDAYVAEDCAADTGSSDPSTINAKCAVDNGPLLVHTCRVGPASSPSSYNCGLAGYPGPQEQADMAALTGVTAIDSGGPITGRYTAAQRTSVRGYLQRRFQFMGVASALDTFTGGANVVGYLPATTSNPGKAVLVGSHFDSDGEFDAAAIDNAAGVVVLLDVARHLSLLPTRTRPAYFAAFDLEEEGEVGSKHFLTTTSSTLWHSAHFFDEIGGSTANVNIEADASFAPLTTCMWQAYNDGDSVGAFSIPLTHVSDPTNTDYEVFLAAGYHASNVSTGLNTISGDACIQDKPCDAQCNGNCATRTFCNPTYCQITHHCNCQGYKEVNFEKLASVSLLARTTIGRIVTGQNTSCPN